jgi:hypothetical protein
MRTAAVFLLSMTTIAGCAQLAALFGGKSNQPQQPTAEQQQQAKAAERKQREEDEKRAAEAAAERERQEQEQLAELERLRADLSSGAADKPDAARAFAGQVKKLDGSSVAQAGKVDIQVVSREAAGYLDAALKKQPGLDLLAALADLPRNAEVDATFVRACPVVRPRVPAEAALTFVGDCLERAGGDASRLKWPGSQKDLTAYKKFQAEELRRAQEEEARRAKEEAEQAAQASRGAGYVAAAVFAAGRCNFGNCAKDGWSIDTQAGTVRVRCNFSNCLKDGWTADMPDGKAARTQCSFGDCFKDGWRTDLPDGSTASTRCNFSNCPKDGWTTDIPSYGTARTSCNFQDCLKDGWTTDLPDGGQVRCRCNFQDCLANGASCE